MQYLSETNSSIPIPYNIGRYYTETSDPRSLKKILCKIKRYVNEKRKLNLDKQEEMFHKNLN